MKNPAFTSVILLFLSLNVYCQVGIGTTTPNAQLDISASNQASPNPTDGLLIPKIDDFPVSAPAAAQDGMLVFATGLGTPAKGFYYWDNTTTSWEPFSSIGAEKINELSDGKSDDDGTDNGSSIFFGINAGVNDDGTDNRSVGVGFEALQSSTTGFANVALGVNTMYSTTVGLFNTGLGYSALYNNINGSANVAIGSGSLFQNTSGSNNLAAGNDALRENTTGIRNVGLGLQSEYNLGNSSKRRQWAEMEENENYYC